MVINATRSRVVDLDAVRQTVNVPLPKDILDALLASGDILRELYLKTDQAIDNVDLASDPFLHILGTIVDNDNVMDINQYNPSGIITRRYEIKSGRVVTYCSLYDVDSRMLLVVNNFIMRRGYDKKYILKELTGDVVTTINNNFMSHKDHIT